MVNGIKSSGEIQESEGCDRPFSHVEKIVLNIEEGTFGRMMFSVSYKLTLAKILIRTNSFDSKLLFLPLIQLLTRFY